MSIKSKFKHYIEFINNYRIHVHPGEHYRGIKDTLVGWAIIGLIISIKIELDDPLLVFLSFFISYFSAAIFLFFQVALDSLLKGNALRGLRAFFISTYTDEDIKEAHLSVKQRIIFIYLRGIIATTGWIALNVASLFFGYIDNSALFGADALVFTALSILFLGKRLSLKAWGYIFLAFFGVIFILFFDFTDVNRTKGLICFTAAVYSAIAFSTIFFMTTIIVRHDTPTRVAFHQVLTGTIISLIGYLFLFTKFSLYSDPIPEAGTSLIHNSIICGALYAIAIPRFFRAFLFTEPVVLAVLGYTLPLFVLFYGLFKGIAVKGRDIVSNLLIACGCYGLIREEWKEEQKLVGKEKITQVPLYDDEIYSKIKQSNNSEQNLRHFFSNLKKQFFSGKLDRYEYISKKHEFNKLLLEFSDDIKNTDINSLNIDSSAVVFNIGSLNIELETDGAARSAPFEILNFGNYEPEDEKMSHQLLKNIKNPIIFDIGANIGWYTIYFCKMFPSAKVYSFEPVKETFQFLERNVIKNQISNNILMNYGISNESKDLFLYYFKGGSAIASIENLIDHPNARKEKCEFITLDSACSDLKVKTIDFIKCDVEGSELFVLQGAKKVVSEFKPIFFIEICEEWCQKCGYDSKDITEYLRNHGYELFFAVDEAKLEKRETIREFDEGRYNYFFLHKEKHQNLINEFANKDGLF